MKQSWWQLLPPLLSLGNNTRANPDPSLVQVTLKSSWHAPPLVIEVLETVALENPSAFFPFLDLLTNPDLKLPPPHLIHPDAAFEIALSNNFFPDPGARELVEMNMGLHAATPKIEAFYQHYEDNFNTTRGERCGSWVDWYGEVVCDLDTLANLTGAQIIITSDQSSTSRFTRPKLLKFDHILPQPAQTLSPPSHTAILYASLSSPNFRELHSHLLSLASQPTPQVEYVVRYIPPATRTDALNGSENGNYLSGYGVALDLKKMDYLAVDDRHGSSGGAKIDTSTSDKNDESDLGIDPIVKLISGFPQNSSAPPIHTPLSEDEIRDLGTQSILLLLSSPPHLKLNTLKHLCQNLPKYTPLLSRRLPRPGAPDSNETIDKIANEVHANSLLVQGGTNVLWVNGASVQDKDINPWGLMRVLRRERGLVRALTSAGRALALKGGGSESGEEKEKEVMERAQAIELLTHPTITASQSQSVVLEGLFDASDRVEGGGIIVWWNDLEKDSRYKRWSPSLYALLHQYYPGQLPSVKLNLFNIVLVLDLSRMESLRFIVGPIANIVGRGYPLRMGVVPLLSADENGDGTRMARLFYYLIEHYGRKKTLRFMQQISQPPPHAPVFQDVDQDADAKIDWSIVRSAFGALEHGIPDPDDEDHGAGPTFNFQPKPRTTPETKPKVDLEDILAGKTTYVASLEKTRSYTERLDAGDGKEGGHAFVNGKHFDVDDDFVRQMQMEIGKQMQFLQEQIYDGKIKDDEPTSKSMATYFYDQPSSSQRRNRYIYPTQAITGSGAKVVDIVDLFKRTGFEAWAFGEVFVYPQETQLIPLSMYVIADFDTEHGLELVKEALSSITRDSLTRISFIHNSPVNPSKEEPTPTSNLISYLVTSCTLSTTSPSDLLRILGLWGEDTVDADAQAQTHLTSHEELVNKLTGGVSVESLESNPGYVRACRLVAKELGLLPGERALLVNGRVVGPIKPGEFHAADFEVLASYEVRKRAGPIMNALEDVVPGISSDRASYAHTVSVASSVISAVQQPDPSEFTLLDAPSQPRQRPYRNLESNYTAFEFGDNSTALYHVSVVLDPLSGTAQRWTSLLEWLLNIPDMFIEIHLNPAQYTEIPLKRFYRYNLQPSVHYNDNLEENVSVADFKGLPIEPIYTLAMDVPSSWLVRPREARYDLDNIQLSHLSPEHPTVHAEFSLDYLVIEGHARQTNTNAPPRGVQLELVHGSIPVDDTQVVANLGYLQFKAKPGVFQLGIRPGRGRKIFRMESVGNEGWDSPGVEEVGSEITLTSFEGLTLFPRLTRLPGMEKADVLEEEVKSEPNFGGVLEDIASKVTSLFKTKEKTAAPKEVQAEINIFTVASGLLYERFASIMILSVLRNTKSTVKFWFIENFLSPSFLEFIPHFAEAYNFKYELVTYKWPSWLRAQTEKQRIIWAYKILFLDVLFPMDLKKVIFVDADQIVRADLKELVDLDLHGAPYGYTPMGDDNAEMEGFRFWKTGYWKEFLQGRPYHISALYVVDLVRFRQLAAGDMLRGQYQGLSADPNSLANLDQDLPNNLQREVPIFSLHEDWLWCETWCSKGRLHRAKTIDLCQNPLTKEPKLSRARKIPEWEAYDAEIALFASKLAEDGIIRSGMAAADANVLANEGPSSQVPSSSTLVAIGESTPTAKENYTDQPRDEL